MSDRPTPETDIEHLQFAMGGFTLDFCRKLERERDSAMELAQAFHKDQIILLRERDEARNKMADALQEVDLRTLDYLRLREVIIATLEENRHLADGDDCTLTKLKSVVPDWK